MNPENPDHRRRLQSAVDWSRWKLEPWRRNFVEMTKELVGRNWGANGARDKVPVNLLNLSTTIYQRQLVPRSPRYMISTQFPQLKSVASNMEVWTNARVESMDLASSIRRIVLDALLCMGIAKVGLCNYLPIEWEGFTHDYGKVFVDKIEMDDWVHDMFAKRWDQVAFMGHRYCMPLEVAKEAEQFKKDARQKLTASPRSLYNERGGARINSLSYDAVHESDELEDMVEVWEIWLPRDRLLVTLSSDEDGGGVGNELLRVVEWKGPDSGPFHILGLGDVPGNLMPSAPGQQLYDLHLLANKLFRKLGRQAERLKTVTVAPRGSADDEERFRSTDDGGTITMDSPEAVREVTTGGVNNLLLLFFMQVKQLFLELGGNLGAIGGLGPQSETLGQDEMIHANSSKTLQEMQARVLAFAREIGQSMTYYWWNDPIETYEVETPIPQTSLWLHKPIKPEDRADDFRKLNFDINPYSLQIETPSSKLNTLKEIMQTLVLPLLPMLGSRMGL